MEKQFTMPKNRDKMDDVVKRRFFVAPSFDIYKGVKGLYDYGPSGCALKTNLERFWREHFVLEEDMLEICASCLTPEIVLKTSGHVAKFDDLMVKDLKAGSYYRIDKIVEAYVDKKLTKMKKKKSKNYEKVEQELLTLKTNIECMEPDEVYKVMQKYKIKSPDTGNPLSEPVPFNLMFQTQIGPKSGSKGYLRPETAQGMFVNFKKLLDFNNKRMPFACAQMGLGFRNEIAPRSGQIRKREFQMAEIEHFVDPNLKDHPKFKNYKDMVLPLLTIGQQEKNLGVLHITAGEAVEQGIVNNETLCYFICRTYLFFQAVGIDKRGVKFRQHLPKEMAHYASDCWDGEILMSYGWVECCGIADRSCFDLTNHMKVSKEDLQAARQLDKPVTVDILKLEYNLRIIGPKFKKNSRNLMKYLNKGMSEEDKQKICTGLEANNEYDFEYMGFTYKITPQMMKFTKSTLTKYEEKFLPGVIEPSFGISRIFAAILEYSFKVRKNDAKRTFFYFKPKIAPVKCSILPLIVNEKFSPYIKQVEKCLKKQGISCKIDRTNITIGRRYARTDEIGIPFGVTIDEDTLKDNTVTLREILTMKQIRIPIDELAQVVWQTIEGFTTWEKVSSQYPEFKPGKKVEKKEEKQEDFKEEKQEEVKEVKQEEVKEVMQEEVKEVKQEEETKEVKQETQEKQDQTKQAIEELIAKTNSGYSISLTKSPGDKKDVKLPRTSCPQKQQNNDKYTVSYFPLYAKGEFVRVALVLANANWEDKVVEFKDWKMMKSNYPSGFLPVLQVNNGPMMDQTKALVRYICEVHGITCANPKENFLSEQLIELITDDCKVYTPEVFSHPTLEEKLAFCKTRSQKMLPGFLKRISKNCSRRIQQHGWAVTDHMVPGDVFLLAWLSKNIFNPYRTEITEPMLKEFPNISKYWECHSDLLKDYMENRRAKYFQ